MKTREQEYREKAEECFQRAEQATTEESKDYWLKIAEEWLALARAIHAGRF